MLTAKERKTLNDAMAIIDRHTAQGSSLSIYAARFNTHPFSLDVTYFDSNPGSMRGQHNNVRGATFADKIETVIAIEARAAERAEENRAKHIERLRTELASLTDQAA